MEPSRITPDVKPQPMRMSQAEAVQSPDDDDVIDLRAIAGKLWQGKWIIGITTLVATVMAYLVVAQMTPQYRASAKVMFDLEQRNVVDIKEVLVRTDLNEDSLQNEVEILRSASLIERVVDVLHLDLNPEFNTKLRPEQTGLVARVRSFVSLPPELGEFLMDHGVISPPPPPPDEVEAARRERLAVIENVRAGLALSPIKGSKVIDVAFTSENPQTAARIVNALANQYIIDQLDSKLEATRTATDWLTQRVGELQQRLQAAEEAVEAGRAAVSLETGQGLDITRQQLQELNAALSKVRSETSAAQARYDRLVRATNERRDFGAIPEFRESPIIQGYRTRLSELQGQMSILTESVPEGHPARFRLDAQIAEVRQNIESEAARVVEAARTALEALEGNENALQAEVRSLETKAQEQAQQEVHIRQLEREAQASRALYENFLARLKETSQQEKLQNADARILSPAEAPLLPASQSKKRVLMLGVLLGLMSGTGIVLLLDRLNNTFRSPGQLEALSGVNLLGTLPSIGKRIHRSDIVEHFRKNPKGSLAESVRSLRTSILFSNVDTPPRTVMFTSSVPREGKSTTSMLVALTSRQMGKSAVIVDCDLRLPSLARLLNADDGKAGLLSVIEGAAAIDEAIFQDPDTGLHVLMTKPHEPRSNINAADILSSHRFRDLIADLKARYDLVILDTPPTLIVADARILSSLADAVVYVVRWDDTPRDAVLEGIKELRSVNAPIAGVALSLINEARASRYSYDGYSYYKGRYKDYYVS